jgi:hypothetical protein
MQLKSDANKFNNRRSPSAIAALAVSVRSAQGQARAEVFAETFCLDSFVAFFAKVDKAPNQSDVILGNL